jgi:hypothetical protein
VINGCGIEVGPDFLINEIVVGNQDGPRATAGPGVNGIYFVVWNDESATPPDLDPAVRGRVLRKDGTYAGEDMVIATSTAGAQSTPNVAAGSDGFLVVWESEGREVRGRRFDAAGAPRGLDFAVSNGAGIEYPAVVWTGDRYLVAWESREVDKEIRARFVDASGDLLGDEFRVNASTPGEQLRPAMASAGGTVLAVWIDEGPLASGLPSVIAGRMIAGESTIGEDFLVSPGASSNQVDPSIVGAADGFTVIWSEEDAAEPGVADVWSRTLDLSGAPRSEPMRVHSTIQGDQDDPNVTRGPNGVLASWGDMSMSEPDPFLDSVRYRFFPDEGTPCE